MLSFSGTEQRDAATVLTQDALQSAVGTVPDDLDLVIRAPAGDPAVAARCPVIVVARDESCFLARRDAA